MIGACMNKLLGSMVEQEMSKWAENNNKRAIGQAGFRPKHSTIDHLITLRVITENCRLKGQTMYCCFVDFQKAFDTIPRANLWARMESLGVPTYLRRAMAHMYREVRCKIKTHEGYSREFMSNMGVKQGCPLSPTLFGLCIDQLEEIITQCMKEEADMPKIGTIILLLLIYADDVLFSHHAHTLQKMMNAVSDFCKTSGLAVNVTKTKVMVIKTHHTGDQPTIMYNGHELEVVDRFNYLGIDIPSNHAWGKCAQKRLDAGKAKYYEFENMCHQSTTQRWELKSIIFDTCVVQTILYGVEAYGDKEHHSIFGATTRDRMETD
ncbi:hypothetical protein L7F22_040373 [Adiantum nelumboides]|nr:hypothetical protein [Adiantum nelumboides]